jgi:hypothetical protein
MNVHVFCTLKRFVQVGLPSSKKRSFKTVRRAEDVHNHFFSITSQFEFIEIESACHYSGTAIFDETPCTKSDNFK